MTMLNTIRMMIEQSSRRLLCGFLLLLGVAASTSVKSVVAADYGLVRYQPEQSSPATVPDGDSAPQSTAPKMDLKSSPIYSDGDVIYEGPDGIYPFEGSDMLSPDCGYGCPPSWTATVDALYFIRGSDSQSSLSTAFRMPDFDYDTAGRFTLNHRFDCLIGWEAAYLGPFEWNQTNQAAGAGLISLLPPVGLNFSAFNNAIFHQQIYDSRLQSFEFSQKWWGWDVITTSAGVKFIDVEEDFVFASTDGVGDTGVVEVLTNNHLFGSQVGLDLILPVGRFSTTTRLRGSIYANFSDTSILIANAGTIQVNTAEDTVDFASLIELGYHVSYYVTPRIAVRAGYESMWLYGLALAPDNLTNLFNLSDKSVDANGDAFYHGATASVEVNW